MPHLADVRFSREATVSAVRDYYQYIIKLYLPDSVIVEPPEGGWPEVNQDNLGYLGKTDEVIDLLRHLPYIRGEWVTGPPQVAPGTAFVDWESTAKRPIERDSLLLGTQGDKWESVPSHVVGLAWESRSSFNFNLDTKLGIIHWLKCPHAIEADPPVEPILDDPGDYAPEEELQWRARDPAWAVTDLFRLLKGEFEQLNFVPQGPTQVDDDYSLHSGETGDGSSDAIRAVFRTHGWPNLQTYRKDDCLKALREMLEEKYPSLLIGQ